MLDRVTKPLGCKAYGSICHLPGSRWRAGRGGFVLPRVLWIGAPISVKDVEELLGVNGHHGAIDPAEGAVWRVERRGQVDFLGKYVRPDKIDGRFLPEISGQDPVWNWRPQ